VFQSNGASMADETQTLYPSSSLGSGLLNKNRLGRLGCTREKRTSLFGRSFRVSVFCGLNCNSFTIVIYDRNDSAK
jgi:hypothetical protein